mgnify:CR=1 FL=1
MIKIYWASGSPMAWPIQLALREKNLTHQSCQLSFAAGENRAPAFLALNPRGKVPLLVDGDVTVYEAHAIMDYLESAYPEQPLVPDDNPGRIRNLIRKNETAYIYPAADAAISYTSYSSTLSRDDWNIDHLAGLAEPLVNEFKRWNGYLLDNSWLCGECGPMQADLFLIPLLMYMKRFGFDYAARGLPALAAYSARAERRESVQATWPPHWLQSEGDPTFSQFLNCA